MTTQESFKRRIRTRMAQTGERYGAARRALLTKAVDTPTSSGWVAKPEQTDATVRTATGRSWDEWVALIDSGPGRRAGHTAIATWLREHHNVDGWWAQGVTVGYERITGIRLPGQMPDGTFTISRSRTLELEVDAFRMLLADDADRDALFPGYVTTPRSRPGVKAPRFALTDTDTGQPAGTLQLSLDPLSDRVRLTVTHSGLPSPAACDAAKELWSGWLAALVP